MAAPQVRAPSAIQDRKSLAERRGEHQVPVNKHLWVMVQRQARAKYLKFPSPAASAWMHRRYVEMGGRFRNTKNKEDSKLAHEMEKKKSHEQKKNERQEEENAKRERITSQTASKARSIKKKKHQD